MKKNIAIIMGGYSSERGISLKSGEMVYRSIDSDTFKLWKVDINKKSWQVDIDDQKIELNKSDFSFIYKNETIHFDAIFNAIHGDPGENGVITAYFDSIGIPYSCPSTNEMKLTFDKKSCNALLASFGILVPESINFQKGDSLDANIIKNSVGFPCFIKPSRAGSSFGISRVQSEAEIKKALDYAFTEDDQVLIEREIKGIEVAVGVYNFDEETISLPITEIITDRAFFDFKAKYEGKSQEITPARLKDSVYQQIQSIAVEVFEKLDLKGFARIDFIVENDQAYLIEVNSIPGMSGESILPKQIQSAGMAVGDFFEKAIIACL